MTRDAFHAAVTRRKAVAALFPATLGWGRAAATGTDAREARVAGSNLGIPLLVSSSDEDGRLTGKAEALLAGSAATTGAALADAASWCDILLLHLNTVTCTLAGTRSLPRIELVMARKAGTPSPRTYTLSLDWRALPLPSAGVGFQLTAAAGPLGTSDYRIDVSIEPARHGTLVTLAYGCRVSPSARLAMNTYLATFAASKVGFSRAADGTLVGGMRGVVERSVVRYYLALEAWLGTTDVPAPQRLEARLNRWFDGTERFALQLREIPRETYLRAKLGSRRSEQLLR
jgi:hypothetical protein